MSDFASINVFNVVKRIFGVGLIYNNHIWMQALLLLSHNTKF